jgi:hypothetical protein
VDGRDSLGFIFKRSPALAGSCRIGTGAEHGKKILSAYL